MNRFLALGAAALAAGCTMAPEYSRPAAPVPAGWPSGPAYPQATDRPDAVPARDLPWQGFFDDVRLQQVIEMALANSRDLRIAALNVERARALYGIQRDSLLPTLDAVAAGSRQRVPADLSYTGKRATVEQYSVHLGLAWEIDFFGRIRSLSDAALEEFLATREARRSAQILLVSGVAGAYLALAADRESLTLAETTIKNLQETHGLIQRLYERGLIPELDLHRAQAQMDAARGAAVRLTQQVAQDENALSCLVGAPVPGDLLPADLGQVVPPHDLAPGVSSEVLLLRPDILAAENRLKAANANIGAARAALFPRVSLTASAGTASSDLSGLFKAGSGAWGFAPQIVLPIFDTRVWSAATVSEVDREIALAQYERAIQASFREVADTLAVRGTVDRHVTAQESQVRALSEAHRLASARYTKGIDSYLGVLDAQRSLYAAQQGLVLLRLSKLANQVRMYAVLGGGWQTPEDLPPGQPGARDK